MIVVIIAGLAFVLGMNLFLFFGGELGVGLRGKPAPQFELPVLGSEEVVALADHLGEVVLIDFWATWCPPCREQMPALKALGDEPMYEDLVILSINTDDFQEGRQERVGAFLRSVELQQMPTLLDDGHVRNLYGIRSIPTLVLVDRQGKVVYEGAGLHGEEELRRLLARHGGLGR
jgi:thiol-disulfide isomerase/thioredoxin